MAQRHRPGLLVSDFDGTITANDFFRLVVENLAPEAMSEFWQGYQAGRYTHFEALAGIFGSIRAEEAALLELVHRAAPEPELAQCIQSLHQSGWDVEIASAGCGWYVERVLAGCCVTVPVHVSPGRFESGRGLIMEMPVGSPYHSQTHGIDKAAVVKAGLARGQQVAFAGDGYSDLPAARLVPEQRRFARLDLAEGLRSEGLSFVPFERWRDVARELCAAPEEGPTTHHQRRQ